MRRRLVALAVVLAAGAGLARLRSGESGSGPGPISAASAPAVRIEIDEPAFSGVVQVVQAEAPPRARAAVAPADHPADSLVLPVRGVVLDPAGDPVEGALVRGPAGRETWTDETGRFELALDAGEGRIDVSAAGFLHGACDASTGSEAIVALERAGSIEVEFLDAATGRPVRGASIDLALAGGGRPEGVSSGPANRPGALRVEGLAPGRYVVQAGAPGWRVPCRAEVDVAAGSTVAVTLRAEGRVPVADSLVHQAEPSGGDARIEGALTDRGTPMGDVAILVLDAVKRTVGNATTDPQGRFAIERLPAGSFLVVAKGWAGTVFLAESAVEIAPGTTRVDLEAFRGALIGSVVAGSRRVAGATVAVRREGDLLAAVRTGADGRFECSRLPEGEVEVTVDAGPLGGRTQAVAVEAPEEVAFEIHPR